MKLSSLEFTLFKKHKKVDKSKNKRLFAWMCWVIKWNKRAMIRNYFRIKKILVGNTRPAHDVPGTYPDSLLKVLTSGTYRGPSGDSQGTNTKTDDFMKKLFFRSIRVLVLHICFCFLQEEQIFKSSKRRRLRDPVAGRPCDQMMGRSRDVCGMSAKHVF